MGIGCWVKPGIFAVVALGVGLWMMFGSGPSRRISVAEALLSLVLVAVGTVVLLAVAAWVLFLLWVGRMTRDLRKNMDGLSEGVRRTQGREGSGPAAGGGREPIEVQAQEVKPDELEGGEKKPGQS